MAPMTSVLPPPSATERVAAHPRGLVVVASLGGALAALGPLVVAMAVGVVGWFLTDAGAHGRPSSGLRVGALGWLVGHGSGVDVTGVPVRMVPLAVPLLAAVVCWRLGRRVGELVAGHGPDRRARQDGERDLVVPTAAGVFAATYVLVAVVVAVVASRAGEGVSIAGLLPWCLLLAGGAGGTGIAVGSGRAATWVGQLPEEVRDTCVTVAALVLAWTVVGGVLLAVGLGLRFGEAADVVARTGGGTGAVVLLVGLALLLVPNAVVFAGAYALGPGFALGTGTLVSPTAVVLGPVPLFPLVAAVPAEALPAWAEVVLSPLPFVVSALVVARIHVVRPTARWDVAVARAAAAGVGAAVVLAILAAVAGGPIGPGRMTEVGPFVGDVLVRAVVSLTAGAVVAALAVTAWQRRGDA